MTQNVLALIKVSLCIYFPSKILSPVKPYQYGYQIKSQYLLIPKVRIRIRIFDICLRLEDSVRICAPLIFDGFYIVTCFSLFSAVLGFEPMTLGFEAQAFTTLATEARLV